MKNLSGIYSGGFLKSFGLELITFPGFFKKITLRQIIHHITQHRSKRKGYFIENAAMPQRFLWEI